MLEQDGWKEAKIDKEKLEKMSGMFVGGKDERACTNHCQSQTSRSANCMSLCRHCIRGAREPLMRRWMRL
jgi:hypothetical protein